MHNDLLRAAQEMRIHIVRMLAAAGSGHPGGSLSATDIVASLYFKHMRLDPDNPDWEDRDRFVLAKGHAAPALYAALAMRGFFPVEDLVTIRKIGSHLQGHPCMSSTPGIDMSTGSLGQGLSVANGMALAGRLDGRDYWVYCLMGDGEQQEGQVWEAAMSAAHYGLDHLIAFVDHNGLQIDGSNDQVMAISPLAEKYRAFGWNVIGIDGHDFAQIDDAIARAKACVGKPTVIVCETVKGKGVSFMENAVGWHGKAAKPAELEAALAELEAARKKILEA